MIDCRRLGQSWVHHQRPNGGQHPETPWYPTSPGAQEDHDLARVIRTHMVLMATDFFTTEVWTWGGLVTYYVLFFIHLDSRKVQSLG